MIQPWFDPNQYAWIPGAAYGVIAIDRSDGGLAGASRKGSWLYPAGLVCGAAVAVVLLLLGIAARVNGQPWGVWYALLLPRAIGTLVVGANSLVILRRYREVEERRLAAKDLLG